VLGLGQGEMFLASDPAALLAHTRDVVFLDNGDVARLTRDERRPSGIAMASSVERPSQRLNWDPIQTEKGGYKHFMLKEIHEQPEAVQNTFAGRVDFERAAVAFDGLDLLVAVAGDRRCRASSCWPAAPRGTPPTSASS
jgi:glutamine---fructose-6-phosphate transaminase (isomerizing)